eukprot:s510_g3.t1
MARPTKKGEFIQAIKDLGETPPTSWSVSELKVRLTELEESKGIYRHRGKTQTSLQLWMIRLNEAKKNKATLQQFTKDALGVPITGNEVMEELSKKCVEKIYMVSKPDGTDPMGFGRHASKSYMEVKKVDPGYVAWAQKTVGEGETCIRLTRFVKWIEMENHPEQMDTYPAVPPPLTSKVKKEEHEATGSTDQAQTHLLQQMATALQEMKEELTNLKEERPHKRSETSSVNSFDKVEMFSK